MDPLADALGIDVESAEFKRARYLAKQDYALRMALVRMRADKGISQTEMARRLGVTQATVSAFEQMDNDPKLSTVRRYATAVGALVTHTVEADNGQLMTTANMWDYKPSIVEQSIEGHRLRHDQLLPRDRQNTVDKSHIRSRTAAESKRTDFGMAA